MPTIPGAEERIVGRLVDLANVMHPNYGVVADGVEDDTAGIQEWLDYLETSGNEGSIPAGIYGITADLDIPPSVVIRGAGVGGFRSAAGTTNPVGSVIKWIGGGAPVSAVLTCNLLGQHNQVTGTRILGLRVDCNGSAVGARFYGLGSGCELDIDIEQFSSRGLVLDRAAAAYNNQHLALRLSFAGMAGARAFHASYLFDSVLDISVRLAIGEVALMARGIDLVQYVARNIFTRCNVDDANLPIDSGTGAGGGVVANTFQSMAWDHPTAAPADVTIGAFTGTVGFAVRTNANENNFHSIIGLVDRTGLDRAVYDQAANIIIGPLAADEGVPLVFGSSGDITLGAVAVTSITFPDATVFSTATLPESFNMVANEVFS